MERDIAGEAAVLLRRLSYAEKRASLLKDEIKELHEQIRELTQSASTIFKDSKSEVHTSVKRELDVIDSPQGDSKRLKGAIPVVDGYAIVYTDGACENNGQKNAKAGIGVWFSDDNPLNISKPVTGKATNNRAEIQAPTEALKVLKSLGYSKVKILTDSQFTINCMTKWIFNWKKKQWKLAGGGPVKNKEELMALDTICQQFEHIKWEYCPGHQGVWGNEQADKLAREGALRYQS